MTATNRTLSFHEFFTLVAKTDSYKLNHWNQYPEGTEFNFAYFESRPGALFDETPFFTLQAILKAYFVGVVVTQEAIDLMVELSKAHFGADGFFNKKGWEYILKAHGGRLPLRIKAVPEGTPVTVNNVLMTVENTDPKCAWLTNYVESVLTHVWSGSTVAALSRAVKKDFVKYLDETSDNPGAVNFMLHDFGYRGCSSDESAAAGGAGHLINFLGTDTVTAMLYAKAFYNAPFEGLAYSVAATEHSIMTARGEQGEAEVLDQLLLNYPKGILSCVADSFDYYNFVENLVGNQFKDKILAREGIFVVRPDSITPTHNTPESLMVWTLQSLATSFGYTLNTKGFMVINPKVRALWGDGIDRTGINKILAAAKAAGFSVENMVFGMGGGLLQKINRDTQRFAFKSSAQRCNGVWHDIYKKPKDLSKASKRGKLALIKEDGKFKTVQLQMKDGNYVENPADLLKVVFENGELFNEITFAEVRANGAL
jgi:nicotinamide phosphoribosyltransferase